MRRISVTTRSIAERLREKKEDLTRAERQLTHTIMKNYPASGLGTITTLASAADVSTPTVARLVQKLGFSGFPEFQSHLHEELNEKISGPIAKRESWVEKVSQALYFFVKFFYYSKFVIF